MDGTTDTTDCPICLCPIPSEPWGVTAPCGHPFHRGCWDQIVANHANGGGGRGGRRHPLCAVCKGATKAFVPVFLDLGNEYDDNGLPTSAAAASAGRGADNGVIDLDGNDANDLERLVDEWDELWKELEMLCGCDASTGSKSSDDDDVIDMTDRSDRAVADICGAIDLTQASPPQRRKGGKTSDDASVELQMQQFEANQKRIKKILHRLDCIHGKIMSSQQLSASNNASTRSNARQIERLRSKVKNIQSTNADLMSQTRSLQAAKEGLSSQLEEMKRAVSERTVEAERTKQQYRTLSTQFKSMEDSYKKYTNKSSLEKSALQEKVHKLQAEYAKLSDKSSYEDMQEMEEVRRRYGKMAQEVHDLKAKKTRMEKELSRKERDWEVRLEKERERCEDLKGRMKQLLKRGGGGGRMRSGYGPEDSTMSDNEKEAIGDDGGYLVERHGHATAPGDLGGLSVGSTYHAASNASKMSGGGAKRNSSGQDAVRIGTKPDAERSMVQTVAKMPPVSRMSHESISRPKKSKAMEALDKASARKLPVSLKRPHQPREQHQLRCRPPSPRNFGLDFPGEPDESESNTNHADGVQLMMRTSTGASLHSSKKRRRGGSGITGGSGSVTGVNSGDSAPQPGKENNQEPASYPYDETSGGRQGAQEKRKRSMSSSNGSSKRIRASYSPREKGNLSSFFKPRS